MSLTVSLHSELLKLKRTSSLYLCFIAAALLPVMLFFEIFTGANKERGLPWSHHFLEGREAINLVLLPLFVILISTLLLQMEYRDKTWKQVLTSPQKFINVFLAKFIMLHLLILLFIISYNVLLALTGVVIDLVYPDLFEGGYEVQELLLANGRGYLLILGISAIQFWLALRFKNFITPLAIGLCLWFMGPLMVFEFKWAFADRYPYSLSILSVLPRCKANVPAYLWYSAANAVVFLAIAFAEFRRRKIRV